MVPVILIVEDDADILKVLKDQLELDGYQVLEARQGDDGLKIAMESKPHLVILDLNLPDMDGLRMCRELRKISHVPVIMLTVRDTISDKLRGFEVGADDYITKPFEYLELAARVRACLKRNRVARPQDGVLDLDRIKLFPHKREVCVDGKPVGLTKREYELLELLALNRGRVLTRDFIMSQLWKGKEIYPWSRAVDVHIQRLRRKIEPDPEHPRFIITHPGVGYRFEI
jgi:two-component system alkaline phosphatase synthesis response regulator PhoP/OmpR family response regulator RpaB